MIRIFLLQALLIFVPGCMIHLLLRKFIDNHYSTETHLFFSIVYGIIFNSSLYIVFSILELKIILGLIIEIILISLLFGVITFQFKEHFKFIKKAFLKFDPFLGVILLLLFILFFFKKGEFINDIHYLVPVTKSLNQGSFVNSGFIFPYDIYDPRFSFNPALHYNIMIGFILKVPEIKLWMNSPVFWVLSSVISVYAFSERIFKERKIARAIVLVMFLHFSGILFKYIAFSTFSRPQPQVLYILFPFFLFLFLEFLKQDNKFIQLLMVITIFILFYTHAYFLFLLFITLTTYYFLMFYLNVLQKKKKENKKMFSALLNLGYWIILILPLFYFKLKTFVGANPSYFDIAVSNVKYFIPNAAIFLNKYTYIVKPMLLFRQIYSIFTLDHLVFPLTPIIAFIGSFIFLLDKKFPKNSRLLLFSMSIIVPIIGFNPILVPLLSRTMSFFYIQRLGILIPAFYITGYLGFHIWTILIERFKIKKSITITILVIVVMLISKGNFIGGFHSIIKDVQNSKLNYKIPSVIQKIHELDITDKYIFTDIHLGYYITVFSDNYVYAIPSDLNNPNFPDSLAREEYSREIVIVQDEKKLKEFFYGNFDYIIISPYLNKSIPINKYPQNIEEMLWYFYHGQILVNFDTIINKCDFTELVWEDEHYKIYKIKHE